MTLKKHCLILGGLCVTLCLVSCDYGPPEKVHFQLEDNFSGLVQIVIPKNGIRRAERLRVLELDIPSSGVLYVKSWPTRYQLSGSKSGTAFPIITYSDETSISTRDNVSLRNLGTTTLGDGTILNWFYLGTEVQANQARVDLLNIAPGYLDYYTSASSRPIE